MKKIKILISILLAFILSISVCGCSIIDNFFPSNWKTDSNGTYYIDDDGITQTGWATIDGRPYYFNEDGTLADYVKVIDVSQYQGDVDWNSIANQGIKMAVIRSSYGWENYPEQVDENFKKNIEGAKAAGLKVGVYHYCYATTPQEAKKEADYCLKAVSNYDIDLPIAYDIEEDNHYNLTSQELTDVAVAFCEEIKSAGYIPMIYSKLDILQNRFDYDRISSYDLWVAQYASSCSYPNKCLMWQYTETGLIDGIDGYVDFSYYYFNCTVPKNKIL